MDYLIPVCLGLLGLFAMFAPNWLMPVLIAVGGWLGVLACGWLWLMIFLPLLNGVGLAYALWLMFKGHHSRPAWLLHVVLSPSF